MKGRITLLVTAAVLVQVGPALAQARRAAPREPVGFISVNGGVQNVSSFGESVAFEQYAETGTLRADVGGNPGPVLDVSGGLRIWKRIGLGAGVTRTSVSSEASIRADVPHPLVLDQHRAVEGTATDLSRAETGVHVQLYWEPRLTGRVRMRVFGGPSYLNVRQDVIEGVDLNETYPFDVATFRAARTRRASGSAVGGHAGIDFSWMLSRQLGAGVLFRYAGARIDLNGPSSRTVSSDAGGLQAGGGIRLLF